MVASQSRDDRRGRGGGTGWRFGLGLVPNVTFGVHWDRASRIPGVAWFMRSRLPSGSWFVGIDEFTAILGDGVTWEVAGRGTVTVRPTGGTVATYRSGDRFAVPSDA
jgi:hypothetical protein